MAMTAEEEQIAQIEEELDGARRDLKETISTVEAKVSEAEAVLNPRNLLRENLVGASCAAGLLGFVAGSGKYRKVAAAAIVFALGYAVWNEVAYLRSNNHGGEPDNS
jgi:hypothetical protein